MVLSRSISASASPSYTFRLAHFRESPRCAAAPAAIRTVEKGRNRTFRKFPHIRIMKPVKANGHFLLLLRVGLYEISENSPGRRRPVLCRMISTSGQARGSPAGQARTTAFAKGLFRKPSP